MVTAWIAEISQYGVNVKDGSGRTVKVLRSGDLRDSSKRGVNLDEGDYLLEKAGYVMGVARWNEDGKYYKAVIVPEGVFRQKYPVRLPPAPTVESNMRAFGNPEGRRFTAAESRARLEQVRATGNTRGWEKRLR